MSVPTCTATINYVPYLQISQAKHGYETYYWESDGKAELDFVIQKDTDIIPIEVKTNIHVKARSLDLYMKMLSDSINKLKGIEEKKENEANYNIKVAKHVSNKYVSDDDIKIYIHKEIKSISSLLEKQRTEQELIDRFGTLTDEIKMYINKQYMEGICKKQGVESITERNQMLEIIFGENANIDGGKLFKCAYEVNRMFTFEYKAKKVHMKLRVSDNSWINDVIKIIESYNK